MMSQSDSNLRPDILEILAGDALGELDAFERERLAGPLDESDRQNAEELKHAATALQLALANRNSSPMPVSLKNKIALDAANYLATRPATEPVQRLPKPVIAAKTSPRERLAWLATAASLILTVTIWGWGNRSANEVATGISPTEARAALLTQAKDWLQVDWAAGTTPFADPVVGDVVWSNSRQQGFLRFVGMPINDPNSEQYQLWIIDPKRDDEPIDGGVFDVTETGEVIIPIDAKLRVVDPAAFAVTIEKPGGVVVSNQQRLPLLAKVTDSKG